MYEKFARLLEEKDVTAYRVAKDLELSPSLFSDWKSGKSKPKADKLKKIADYFGVSVESLIDKRGEKIEITPKIRIVNEGGIYTEIFINNKKVNGVKAVRFSQDAGNFPVLQLDFSITDIEIDVATIPDLPEILKPFYEKRNNPAS